MLLRNAPLHKPLRIVKFLDPKGITTKVKDAFGYPWAIKVYDPLAKKTFFLDIGDRIKVKNHSERLVSFRDVVSNNWIDGGLLDYSSLPEFRYDHFDFTEVEIVQQ